MKPLNQLILKNGKKVGFEFKFHDASRLTPSMRIAMEDLQLDSLTVLHPSIGRYELTEKIIVVGLMEYLSDETR